MTYFVRYLQKQSTLYLIQALPSAEREPIRTLKRVTGIPVNSESLRAGKSGIVVTSLMFTRPSLPQ